MVVDRPMKVDNAHIEDGITLNKFAPVEGKVNWAGICDR
jgi:hypothetical protein